MTDIKKQPDTYRVNLFLSFTSAALFAIGFPMTLYEATMAAQDPPQLVLFGTSLELSVLLVGGADRGDR